MLSLGKINNLPSFFFSLGAMISPVTACHSLGQSESQQPCACGRPISNAKGQYNIICSYILPENLIF